MSVSVLGIDIAKQKFDVALLMDGKTKHKTCKNSVEGFETLVLWLEKQGIQKVHACMEATGNYGEDLAIYLHEAGHIVSIVNPARYSGLTFAFSPNRLVSRGATIYQPRIRRPRPLTGLVNHITLIEALT